MPVQPDKPIFCPSERPPERFLRHHTGAELLRMASLIETDLNLFANPDVAQEQIDKLLNYAIQLEDKTD